MFGRFLRNLLRPLTRVRGVFRGGARGSGAATRTTAKSGGGAIAKTVPDKLLETEYREEPPTGIEALLFKQLPRPRLTERNASDLTLKQATANASEAAGFYRYGFPLFTRGDFFYEEVEEEFLNNALGFERDSVDRRFLDVTTLFRKTLNDNTRSMLALWTPGVFLLCVGAPYLVLGAGYDLPAAGAPGWASSPWAIFGAAAGVGLLVLFLLFSWPYKVVQQRNLMNLDNYVTSKFARINNNFQVAKRRALNVERDKRMGERSALVEEAGDWTLAYHWFAMRLMLCELVIRNKFYQVRRNTTLYLVTGFVFSLLVAIIAGLAMWRTGETVQTLSAFAASSTGFMIAATLILRRATGMMFGVIESNEWSRFHLVNLDRTIRDHVGEDKLQIVTFRDRNRFE
ncbi:MAG: hypothetical protein ACX939_01940 [Hyphococcus sp.]